MKVKTVWHWKNIGKAFLMLILAAFIVSLIPLPDEISFFVRFVAGWAVMIIILVKWELWHFE